MAITYDKLLKKFVELNINSTIIKRDNIIGQSAWSKIKTGGNIDMKTLNKLCRYLNCQPGDILEYVPDEESQESNDSE